MAPGTGMPMGLHPRRRAARPSAPPNAGGSPGAFWRSAQRLVPLRPHGAASRAGEGASTAWLGGAQTARLVGPDTAAAGTAAKLGVRRKRSLAALAIDHHSS